MRQDQAHDCKKELHHRDLKATPARLAVLKLLETTSQPVDVQTILDFVKNEDITIDPATVFRIVNAFTEKGLTKQIQFHEGKYRYELQTKDDHHHLICESCGIIEDISDCAIKPLERDIKKKKKFLVKRHTLEFYGLCTNCQI